MASKAPSSTQRSFLWPIVIGVVVVLGLVAVVMARGSRSSTSKEVDARQTSEVVVSGATALVPYDETAADPAVGVTIPTVTGQDFEGREVTIGPDDGAKVIMFVAHWCPHCQAEVPRILAHLDDVPMPDDVELVMVSTSVKPDADNYSPQAWLDDEGWAGTTLADSDSSAAATAMGLSSFPYFVAIDASGEVVARASGEIGNDQFDALVAAAGGDAA